MPAPTTPSQFCDAVPTANSDLCVKVSKFFGIAQLLCDFFSWFLTVDGAISEEVKTEIASFIVPTGFIIPSATLNAGSGYLLCNGQAVSRTTYAALFTAIGTRYGAGDASTTFNVPDMQGRSPIGAGTGDGLTFRDINAPEVGEEDHELTSEENGPHTHTVRAIAANTDGGSEVQRLRRMVDSEDDVVGTIPTDESGEGVGHNTVHPCFVLYYMIKT